MIEPLFEHRLTLAGFETRALELEGHGPPRRRPRGRGRQLARRRVCAARRRASRPAAARGRADRARRAGHAGWFGVIERDPLVRFLLRSPLPLPAVAVRAVVGEAYRQLAFARPRAAAREVVAGFTAHFRDRRAVAGYLDVGRRLLPELTDCFRLADVRVPVLVIWGERDRMVPHRGAQLVLDALPETTCELLEGVGHCPQVEAPDRVAELLLEFLAAPARRAA